jgi:hypothetical protein
VDSLDGNLVSLYVMLCEYVKEAVTSGLIAVLEKHKFIVLLKGMRDILSKLNLLNVSMQTQSIPFSTLKVLVNATREGLKREWIDLSAPSHPMLVSGACVTGGDSLKKLVEQMKSGSLDQDDSDDKTFKYELVSSGGVKRKIGEGEEQHTIPVQGSCTEHAEAVKLLSSYAKGLRQSLQARFVDINDHRFSMSSILRVCPSLKNLRSTILKCNRSEVCLKSTGRTSRKVVILSSRKVVIAILIAILIGHRYPALLYPAVRCSILLFVALSCCSLLYPAVRCSILLFVALSCCSLLSD